MLWKTAKPSASTGRPREASACCSAAKPISPWRASAPRLIRQGRTIPDNRTAVERAAALRESATERSADPAAAPAGFDSGLFTRLHGQPVRRLETLEMLEEHEFDASRAALLYLRLQALVPAATWRKKSPTNGR